MTVIAIDFNSATLYADRLLTFANGATYHAAKISVHFFEPRPSLIPSAADGSIVAMAWAGNGDLIQLCKRQLDLRDLAVGPVGPKVIWTWDGPVRDLASILIDDSVTAALAMVTPAGEKPRFYLINVMASGGVLTPLDPSASGPSVAIGSGAGEFQTLTRIGQLTAEAAMTSLVQHTSCYDGLDYIGAGDREITCLIDSSMGPERLMIV